MAKKSSDEHCSEHTTGDIHMILRLFGTIYALIK
jgi:hypothetical protein